jgi:hypothetical protein
MPARFAMASGPLNSVVRAVNTCRWRGDSLPSVLAITCPSSPRPRFFTATTCMSLIVSVAVGARARYGARSRAPAHPRPASARHLILQLPLGASGRATTRVSENDFNIGQFHYAITRSGDIIPPARPGEESPSGVIVKVPAGTRISCGYIVYTDVYRDRHEQAWKHRLHATGASEPLTGCYSDPPTKIINAVIRTVAERNVAWGKPDEITRFAHYETSQDDPTTDFRGMSRSLLNIVMPGAVRSSARRPRTKTAQQPLGDPYLEPLRLGERFRFLGALLTRARLLAPLGASFASGA